MEKLDPMHLDIPEYSDRLQAIAYVHKLTRCFFVYNNEKIIDKKIFFHFKITMNVLIIEDSLAAKYQNFPFLSCICMDNDLFFKKRFL